MTAFNPPGQLIYDDVTDRYELSPHELEQLTQACHLADLMEELQAWVTTHGALMSDGKVAPAVVELRGARLAFNRCIASLRLPEDDGAKPQRRGAARASYGAH